MSLKESYIRSRDKENIFHRAITVHWYGDGECPLPPRVVAELCRYSDGADSIILSSPKSKVRNGQSHEVLERREISKRLAQNGAEIKTARSMTRNLPVGLIMSIVGFYVSQPYIAIVEHSEKSDHVHPYIVRIAEAKNIKRFAPKIKVPGLFEEVYEKDLSR